MIDFAPAAGDEWDAGNEAPDGDDLELDDDLEDDLEDHDPGEARIEPKFANVVEFVQGYFLPVIRRRISDNDGGLSWDSRWWAYPEVVARLTALHYAWEEARVSDSASAMSSWWIQHLEPHLRIILDGDTGPMANAKADRSFMGWPAMPSDPVPAAVLDALLNQNNSRTEG
ncbi:DUF4913 domain-containing protein [Rhodococcus coprophilus]|uniref:DUF4913 domain-containing protein n=1 Tax=Rhodococcus coprophilus TaxID=38310 RepID=A0A2X4U786_9NOCA|nr:DUF4913 domain-containing protein [Rhodococcus coprophilus]MBM7460753.1 hypothetical protein [Rhodococcus coprophilus]SQI28560.1 Uncharacterised protein [Rhodococcus coprophilus]